MVCGLSSVLGILAHMTASWATHGMPPILIGMGRIVLGAILAIVLFGCATAPGSGAADSLPAARSSPVGTFVLTVRNLDGPQANVLIGDRKVATLNCWDSPVTLTPGDPGLPSLPWAVTILDISHSSALKKLGARTEAGNGPPNTLVIRADHIDSGPLASPFPVAVSPCPPAPSAEPLY
jgi:hypothetical protein